MRRRRQDSDILKRTAEALGVDLSKPYTRDCQTEGHSLDHAINDKIICSICGRTKAEIEAAADAGRYEYETIKYLDE